ncbi:MULTISPECIES: hypothetical protein [unclassified Pseudoalteromonas]|uniref:hypothetical protein n=1 Tax=Pseudoalteromonas sp. bablab_jr010 TaxID=2755063 RepID=UPI0018F65CEC|nr:hypothetical protein [Pseudoalteromonas sp. bablab_jr010]
MNSFEYQIININGIFKLRSTKEKELEEVCVNFGKHGWELASVTFDWFLVSYKLFFKRRVEVTNHS